MSEDEREEKDIVRGYNFAEYHADVYDKTESEVTGAGLDCECLGGGRIEHKPQEKYIKVLPKIRDVCSGGTVYLFFINVLIGPIFHT